MEKTRKIQAEAGAFEEAAIFADTTNAGKGNRTVSIDPGHQGSWVDMSALEPIGPGASERKAKSSAGTQGICSGMPEYELNLQISLQLRDELLSRGYGVILTREDNDKAISNSERATLAWESRAAIYVRIHANASGKPKMSGALAMVPSPSNPYVADLAGDSHLLAEDILQAYCGKTGFPSRGIQYYDNMTGMNWSRVPVMILEMGFMTNESDDLRMEDPSVQAQMVLGIADGIDQYFSQKEAAAAETTRSEKLQELFSELEERYLQPAKARGETWAVSLQLLSSGAALEFNGDRRMKSASVIKVFIMAAIYDRVCCPSSLDRRLSIEERYDGELEDLIMAMITVSDNDASNTLLQRLGGGDAHAGIAVVNQFLEENGYTGTSMGRLFLEEAPVGDNYTTANDCRKLLSSIYSGTCVSAKASEQMYSYLRNQMRLNKIPAGLGGTDARTASKTGELAGEYGDYVENDIAIIEAGNQAYVLCILTDHLRDNTATIGQIAELSSFVYASLTADN